MSIVGAPPKPGATIPAPSDAGEHPVHDRVRAGARQQHVFTEDVKGLFLRQSEGGRSTRRAIDKQITCDRLAGLISIPPPGLWCSKVGGRLLPASIS